MHLHFSIMTTFAIGLTLSLFLPRIMERCRLPGVLGFILAGILLGPGLTGIISQESPAVKVFAEIGKLLFMFFVGFEVDMEQFNKARTRAALFGTLTFSFPLLAGILLGRLGGYSWNAAFLIGSIIASHTLLAHSILVRYGLVKNDAVLVTVGGTIITDIAAMLVLAVCVAVHQVGFSWSFVGTQAVELAIFVPLIIFGLSKLARKAMIRFGQTPDARVIILLILISASSELAHLIHLEGIVGAFLAGIAVKRALRGKFAVEQLEVLANSLFIPTFFLTTGFLVDFPLLAKTLTSRPGIVLGLLGALFLGKFAAAWLTSRICNYKLAERQLMFSLSLPQMAATLASAVVGFEAKNNAAERLLDAEFVNAVLVTVIVTCVCGPVLTERFARRLTQSPSPHHPDPRAAETPRD